MGFLRCPPKSSARRRATSASNKVRSRRNFFRFGARKSRRSGSLARARARSRRDEFGNTAGAFSRGTTSPAARGRGIMRAFAESDVRSESDTFTTRSKISRGLLLPPVSLPLPSSLARERRRSVTASFSECTRTLSAPAGFITARLLLLLLPPGLSR